VSEAWSFSLADRRSGLYCYGSHGRAVIAADGTRADAALSGEGPFTAAVEGLGEFELEALGAPVIFGQSRRREWICRIRGQSSGYGSVALGAALGDLALRRSLWVCLAGELVVVGLAEAAGASVPHGEEELEVHVARGEPLEPAIVADPRLSSTYDSDGRVLRAGLELWEDETEGERERGGALRLTGERLASAQLDGVSVAFIAWHRSNHTGTGCYAIERAG